MIFSIAHIDDACRSRLFVYVGNRQRISGCQSQLGKEGKAEPGKAWVCMEETREWEQVPLSNIVIENRKGDSEMPQGKGAPGRVTHIKSKENAEKAKDLLAKGSMTEVSEEPDGQHRIPGMPRKTHTAIENQAMKVAKAKTAKTRANRKFNEETDILTKMMIEAHMAAGEAMDISNGLETLLDQEPKAVVRKRKDPKNTRPQAHESEADEEEE